MDVNAMRRSLKRTLNEKQNRREFERAAVKHQHLARYGNPVSVLAAIADYSLKQTGEREALTRILLAEQQRHPKPLWSAMLLYAYCPLLQRTRGRINAPEVTPEEIDQLVVEAFLETVGKLPLQPAPDRLCLRLNQGTRRRVFRFLRREYRFQENNSPLAEAERDLLEQERPGLDEAEILSQSCASLWPKMKSPVNPPINHEDRVDLVGVLVELADGQLSEEELELLITTLVRGEMISALARSLYRHLSPAKKKQAYQRLKRRHSRALAKLRRAVAEADVSPNQVRQLLSMLRDERPSKQTTNTGVNP